MKEKTLPHTSHSATGLFALAEMNYGKRGSASALQRHIFSRRSGVEWTDTGAILASVMGYSGAIELLNIPPQLCFNEL